MIEKLVALIREKHKDSDSLVVADVLEEHGEKIANEIVGAALCHLFALSSPPERGAVFMGGNMRLVDSETVELLLSVKMHVDKPSNDDNKMMNRIYQQVGKVIYGLGQHFVVMDENGTVIRRDPM